MIMKTKTIMQKLPLFMALAIALLLLGCTGSPSAGSGTCPPGTDLKTNPANGAVSCVPQFWNDGWQSLSISALLVLFFVAWWWYNWVREKLAFSALLTLVVSGLVVYFLVIEHPIIGSLGVFGWILMTSGILFMLPTFSLLWNTILPKPYPKPPSQQFK